MKSISNDEATSRLLVNNPTVIFIDQYYSCTVKSKFKCLKCGCEWSAIPKGVIKGKNGCPDCGKKKAKETVKYNITTDDFKRKIEKIFGDKLTIIGEYINHKSRIEVKCNICGYVWDSKSTYLMRKCGCKVCGHEECGKKFRKNKETFKEEINKIHNGRIQLIDEYETGDKRIRVKCNVCNHEWSPVARRLLRRGCPKCNFSKGEILISNILKDLNVKFKEQYIFDGLKTNFNGVPIFDFVLFNKFDDINCIIEYDGEQHFKPVKKWGGLKRLEKQKLIDEFKNNFCQKNNIKLIRIPYTEIKLINNEYIKNIL
jgi:predicted  nucleic acid-binding Zn-ribbon protein